jgi:SAM-dependent methyltransferase
MRDFDDLVMEAESADVSGWGFGWLDGRATEERPPWGYARLMAARLARAEAALDLDTGGGEVLSEAGSFPPVMFATENWPVNLERARHVLSPRGVQVLAAVEGGRLPFPDEMFDLVVSRHPVAPAWAEIARVLADRGIYLAQHVGPASAFELIEYFLGPRPRQRLGRAPQTEVADARAAGLDLVDLRSARCRMEFFDIGAVVYILRKCPWWVPDFSVERHRDALVRLDADLRAGRPFVAHSTRHLIEARRRTRPAPRSRRS